MKNWFWVLCMTSICSFSQRQESVDFTKINAEIFPVFQEKEIRVSGTYFFRVVKKTDSIFLDAMNMDFTHVELNGRRIKYYNSGEKIGFKAPKNLGNYKLFLRYTCQPVQTVYFMGRGPFSDSGQIWTQGQGKYTSHWLPSLDDMTDKIEFDLTIRTDEEYEVIANGRLTDKIAKGGVTVRKFDMKQPISSYLTAFVMGTFDKKVLQSESGIPIELYYEPKDSLQFEPTYRYSKEIFDFLEEEIGVSYPWQNYKQVPVQDFLYAGMENTTCTIFSNQYVIDSTAFVDKNYVNVNAHELAHQWFGNLVTEESGNHHWLHEGFATYYAYLAEKKLFGEDHFYWKMYQTAKTLYNLSENEGGEALTNPNANSLTFYEKGAWALLALREHVGDTSFRAGIERYLNTYAFKNATIANFLKEMEKASGKDLQFFRQGWLENEVFPWAEVKTILTNKSRSLHRFFKLQEEMKDSSFLDEERLLGFWSDEVPSPFKREFLFTYGSQISDSALVKLVENETLHVRQTMAMVTQKVTQVLRPTFESFLRDKSYVTQETALLKLWQAFPEKQHYYLDVLDGVVGLPNKNVRILWLTLALITENYRLEEKKSFYSELNGYTASWHNFEVRRLAFSYLNQIQALNQQSLENLIEASDHHVWQFKKSSRNLMQGIYSTKEGKQLFNDLKPQLSDELLKVWELVLNPK